MGFGRWVLGIAVAAVLVGGVTYTVRLQQANHQLALALESERQMTVNDVAYHANQAQTFMGKALASGSLAQTVRYLSNAQQHAMTAGNSFARLPIETNLLSRGTKFIQQVGDLASSLANRQASGQPMTDKDRSLLTTIKQQGDAISSDLATTLEGINRGDVRLVKPVSFSPNLLLKGYQGTTAKAKSGSATPISFTGDGFTSLNDTNKEVPSLIYDGPFSEHVSKEPPRMTGTVITQAQAEAKLGSYVNMGAGTKIISRTEGAGKIPTFSFILQPSGETGTISIDIAKAGGYLVQMLNSRPENESTLDLAAAKAKGLAFLSKLGYESMAPTYGVQEGGTATIVYAWSHNDTVFYRDQVKVKIALDNGEIVGLDARQYLTSHHDRGAMPAKVTAQTAQTKVNSGLSIRRVQLAAIPDNAGTGDVLCWEFTGTMNDQDFLVYVNATTGNEQQILQLIETDQGSFTI